MFSHEGFLTNPLWNDFNSSHRMQNLSMEASSFTSLLQTEPKSIVHSQLNTNGVLHDGSLFKMATRDVYEKQLKIQDERLSNVYPYGVPAPASPAMQSSHIQREDKILLVGPNGISDSAIMHDSTTPRKYTCKICNATFNTSQSYGGHMSSHSKARMKSRQS
ncbi:unnamed protein product [Triticum turgidum subsp. durum]|uniref:C2H2-type domain-containing protein n=1 Tax=Triticum turgidum subsp. durum TaxID=4567 RepID=A0A9R0VG72_TRITD|nr:unnamed protein product [Triticum turgidum subsp. durum]